MGREKTTRTEMEDQEQFTKCKRSIEEGEPKKKEKEAEAENELFDFLKNNMTQSGLSLRELTQRVFGWEDNPVKSLQRLIEWLHLCEKDYEEDRNLSHTDEKYLMYVKKIIDDIKAVGGENYWDNITANPGNEITSEYLGEFSEAPPVVIGWHSLMKKCRPIPLLANSVKVCLHSNPVKEAFLLIVNSEPDFSIERFAEIIMAECEFACVKEENKQKMLHIATMQTNGLKQNPGSISMADLVGVMEQIIEQITNENESRKWGGLMLVRILNTLAHPNMVLDPYHIELSLQPLVNQLVNTIVTNLSDKSDVSGYHLRKHLYLMTGLLYKTREEKEKEAKAGAIQRLSNILEHNQNLWDAVKFTVKGYFTEVEFSNIDSARTLMEKAEQKSIGQVIASTVFSVLHRAWPKEDANLWEDD